MATPKVPSVPEVKSWPVTVSVVEAGRCWRMGKDECYRKAATGELAPGVPVLKLGRSLRVARAHVLAALGIADPDALSAVPPEGMYANGHRPLSTTTRALPGEVHRE